MTRRKTPGLLLLIIVFTAAAHFQPLSASKPVLPIISRAETITEIANYTYQYADNITVFNDAAATDIDGDGETEIVAVGHIGTDNSRKRLFVIFSENFTVEYNATFENLTYTSVSVRSDGIIFVSGTQKNTVGMDCAVVEAFRWDGAILTRYNYSETGFRGNIVIVNGSEIIWLCHSADTIALFILAFSEGSFTVQTFLTWQETFEGSGISFINLWLTINGTTIFVGGAGHTIQGVLAVVRKIIRVGDSLSLSAVSHITTMNPRYVSITTHIDRVIAVVYESQINLSRVYSFDSDLNYLHRKFLIEDTANTSFSAVFDADFDEISELVVAGDNGTASFVGLWQPADLTLESITWFNATRITAVFIKGQWLITAGHYANHTIFTVFDTRDFIPPVIEFISPDPQQEVGGNVSIKFRVFDASPVRISLLVNDTNVSSIVVYGSDITTLVWDTDGYAPAHYNLSLFAEDFAHNTASASRTVFLNDILPPAITVISPQENDTLSVRTSILANISDNYKVQSVSVAVDNYTLFAQTVDNKTFALNITFDPQEYTHGPHTIYITAIDSSSQTVHVAVPIFIQDITPPLIKIINYENYSVVHKVAYIYYDCSDINGIRAVRAYANGTPLEITLEYILFVVPECEAVHNITIVAEDATGIIATETLFLTGKDVLPPRLLSLESMATDRGVHIRVLLTDPSGVASVSLIFAGQQYTLTKISETDEIAIFEGEFPIDYEGLCIWFFVVRDTYNNTHTYVETVYYTPTPIFKAVSFITTKYYVLVILAIPVAIIVFLLRKQKIIQETAKVVAVFYHHNKLDVPIFSVKMRAIVPEDLITSLVSALQSLASELAGSEIRTISFGEHVIYCTKHTYITSIVFAEDRLCRAVLKKLNKIAEKFEVRYFYALENFDGNVQQFADFTNTFKEEFGGAIFEDVAKTIRRKIQEIDREYKQIEEQYRRNEISDAKYKQVLHDLHKKVEQLKKYAQKFV